MAQNIYDNPHFYSGYSQLPRQVYGLDGAPEWPVVQSMLPTLADKYVVDLGCGFGYAARWMREHGAASVLGLDLSEKMIERAKADTHDIAIEYRISNLETLDLPAAKFDLAYSSLAFHYVADFDRLVRTIYSSLTTNGDFVFTIEHPIYMASPKSQWVVDESGSKTWPICNYSIEGERRTDWFAKGVLKYHRTLATTLNTLIAAGFQILRVEEFAPTSEQIERVPALLEELHRPMILMVATKKI